MLQTLIAAALCVAAWCVLVAVVVAGGFFPLFAVAFACWVYTVKMIGDTFKPVEIEGGFYE